MKTPLLCCVLLALITLVSSPAYAQLNGENLLSDNGVKSGSQSAPGLFLSALYYFYNTDTIKNADGNRITIDPTQAGSQKLHVIAPLFLSMPAAPGSLGANYGMMAVMPFANGAFEAPGFGFDEEVSPGAADIYLVPFQLGWHKPRADVVTAFALFAPTGRYTAGADDNLGKRMWSYELSAGTTVYFDEKKTLTFATTGYWEAHTKKKDTGNVRIRNLTLTGAKVGQLLTLEGGLGKSFLEGAASVGFAYYAQWKITHDNFGVPLNLPTAPSIRPSIASSVSALISPSPFATKSKLISLVNVRYFWETGAQLKTQGNAIVVPPRSRSRASRLRPVSRRADSDGPVRRATGGPVKSLFQVSASGRERGNPCSHGSRKND